MAATGIREKAKKFQKFVKGLEEKHPQALPKRGAPLLERFVFYLLAYSNPVSAAKTVVADLTDERTFGSWNEVRVATVRELAEVLRRHGIEPADFLAPRLKQFLQKVFEEVDDTALEPIHEDLEKLSGEKLKKQLEKTKNFIRDLPGIPPWGPSYLLTGLGLEQDIPWDPHTEQALDEQKVFPPKSNLVQKKRVAKALLEGLEGLDPLDVHHLLVEHAKQAQKKR